MPKLDLFPCGWQSYQQDKKLDSQYRKIFGRQFPFFQDHLKFGLPEEVAYIALGHHEDPPKTLECLIVKVADAISGSRMGARKDTYENYIQRLTELEAVATSFAGVEKAYAIQAGRELRAFVMPDKMDDWQATKLARDVADKIEADLKYPGDIKVTVIREKRIIEYAR